YGTRDVLLDDAVRRAPRKPEDRRPPGPGRAGLSMDVSLRVDRREETQLARNALGRAEEEEPVRQERVVEDLQDAIFRLGAEVDQHVPAAHEVQLREWRIAHEIVLGEEADLLNGGPHHQPALDLDEESLDAILRDVSLDL